MPRNYRFQEVAAFHGRDQEGLAENVDGQRIRKGFTMASRPVVLTLQIGSEVAYCQARSVGNIPPEVETVARRMLGLNLEPTPFEEAFADDAALGPLLRAQPGLRIPQTATPFEALTWAIIGQQINLTFAIRLRRRFILAAGQRDCHSGLWCYPGPEQVAALAEGTLTSQQFSRAKSATLIRAAMEIAAGEIALEGWPLEEIAQRLLTLKGVGVWTVNYTLLRGLSHPDCSLHGDAAVRKSLQKALGLQERPSAAEAQLLLQRYHPYRSLAAAHLWAGLKIQA